MLKRYWGDSFPVDWVYEIPYVGMQQLVFDSKDAFKHYCGEICPMDRVYGKLYVGMQQLVCG